MSPGARKRAAALPRLLLCRSRLRVVRAARHRRCAVPKVVRSGGVVELTGNRDEVEERGQRAVPGSPPRANITSLRRRGTRESRASLLTRTMQSGMKVAVRGRALPNPKEQSDHERGVDDSPHCESGEDPRPPRHEAEGYATENSQAAGQSTPGNGRRVSAPWIEMGAPSYIMCLDAGSENRLCTQADGLPLPPSSAAEDCWADGWCPRPRFARNRRYGATTRVRRRLFRSPSPHRTSATVLVKGKKTTPSSAAARSFVRRTLRNPRSTIASTSSRSKSTTLSTFPTVKASTASSA